MSRDQHDVAGRPAKLLMRVPVDRRRPVDARVDPVRDRNDAAVGPHRADVGEDLARLSFVAGHDGLGRELKAPGELARRRRKAEMADARQTEQAAGEADGAITHRRHRMEDADATPARRPRQRRRAAHEPAAARPVAVGNRAHVDALFHGPRRERSRAGGDDVRHEAVAVQPGGDVHQDAVASADLLGIGDIEDADADRFAGRRVPHRGHTPTIAATRVLRSSFRRILMSRGRCSSAARYHCLARPASSAW